MAAQPTHLRIGTYTACGRCLYVHGPQPHPIRSTPNVNRVTCKACLRSKLAAAEASR